MTGRVAMLAGGLAAVIAALAVVTCGRREQASVSQRHSASRLTMSQQYVHSAHIEDGGASVESALPDAARKSAVAAEAVMPLTAVQFTSPEEARMMMQILEQTGLEVRDMSSIGMVALRAERDWIKQFFSTFGGEYEFVEDAVMRIPDQLVEKYPAWEGYPGNAFGASYREKFLGVDILNDERGKGVTVALLDTGVASHAVFDNASIEQAKGYENAVAEGHGTAVASILTGKYGMTNASVVVYPVLSAEGGGSAIETAQAIVHAVDEGVDIISMSLGTYDDCLALRRAVEYAVEAGVLVVASTGNNGVEDVCYPAAYDGVIGVGAINADGSVAGFSNYGSNVDIVAPGVGLMCADGLEDFAEFTGTSAAVPCVSGALANLLAEHRGLGARAEEALKACTLDVGEPGVDAKSGYGCLDAAQLQNIGREGVVDAAAAAIERVEDRLIFTAQNTGTETLYDLAVEYAINGKSFIATAEKMEPGERYVVTVGNVPPGQEIQATLKVNSGMQTDGRPSNQQRQRFFPKRTELP